MVKPAQLQPGPVTISPGYQRSSAGLVQWCSPVTHGATRVSALHKGLYASGMCLPIYRYTIGQLYRSSRMWHHFLGGSNGCLGFGRLYPERLDRRREQGSLFSSELAPRHHLPQQVRCQWPHCFGQPQFKAKPFLSRAEANMAQADQRTEGPGRDGPGGPGGGPQQNAFDSANFDTKMKDL